MERIREATGNLFTRQAKTKVAKPPIWPTDCTDSDVSKCSLVYLGIWDGNSLSILPHAQHIYHSRSAPIFCGSVVGKFYWWKVPYFAIHKCKAEVSMVGLLMPVHYGCWTKFHDSAIPELYFANQNHFTGIFDSPFDHVGLSLLARQSLQVTPLCGRDDVYDWR